MARDIFFTISAVSIWAGLPMPAAAQGPAAECTAPVAPAGELAPWTEPAPLDAADAEAHSRHAAIVPGQAVQLTLHPDDRVVFPAAPGKRGGHGGLAELTVAQAGTYRVALGGAGWIDLMRGGKALASTAHGHGAPCTGIRKIVDFALKPGRYVLAISASADPTTRVLVARKP